MKRSLWAVLGAAVLASSCFGATYYVAPGGADGNDGSTAKPFKTIQEAADIVNPGDTVIVRDGVYTGGGAGWHPTVHLKRSGTAQQPILFKAEHKWRAVLDGQNNTVGHGWMIDASYVTVEGFEIRNYSSHGFPVESGSHITIKGNHIHHIGKVDYKGPPSGLDGCYDDAKCQYVTYDSNVIHDIGRTNGRAYWDHAIYTCGDHNVITNNVMYNCDSGYGVQVAGYTKVENLLISNNTFAWGRNDYNRHILVWTGGAEGQGASNLTIQNNIFFHPPAGTTAIDITSPDSPQWSNITIRNNLLCGAKGPLYRKCPAVTAKDNIEGDPQFINTSAAPYDFHIKRESPAVDHGISALAPVTDADGQTRPAEGGFDIGAFEFRGNPAFISLP